MAKVFLGLGANLNEPVLQLQQALEHIQALPNCSLIQCSSFYGSAPLGPEDQPDYVNAVCEIETTLAPLALLDALQGIEQAQGREKKRRWGERTIDLDILLYDQQLIETERLTVPHSQMALRDFVLVPLAEIAPAVVIPALGSVESLIANLTEHYVKPL